MKKKLLTFILALSLFSGSVVFAETLSAPYNGKTAVIDNASGTKAVLVCFDADGKLCYSNLYTAEDGKFSADIPEEYKDTKKKIYFVETGEIKDLELTEDSMSDSMPESTAAPVTTPAAEAKPEATKKPETKPTSKPKSTLPSIYEKEVDSIYAPALVKEVTMSIGADGNEVCAVTMFYQGKELSVDIDTDLEISTAPDEYSFMRGKTVDNLQMGDVICPIANIAGDTIKSVDFIFRPTKDDIATGDTDYGTNFEKLFASNGKVGGKWTFMRYGEKPSSEKYQYAFGIIGKVDKNLLTLINKEGDEDKSIEINMQNDTIVYSCDVDGREYEVEIGSKESVSATIPKNAFNKTGKVDLNDDYSYNYALVRTVNDIATEIIVYNNYNE
ncbi:MAG: hypothetical protein J1F01_06090 [Oscillospiraceae bacterium]|nr:hypothetical protein [Oscillospiraceae bacterium]